MLISEENYKEEMKHVVAPYLEKRARERWLSRKDGRRIHCMYYCADEPRGMVVISHGFTETAEKYKEVIYYFLQNQYSVYIPEHCGHGFSYRLTKDFSLVHVDNYGRYISDLILVSKHAKRQAPKLPMYLYAHSMGGGIGLAAASKMPELFDRIVASSPMIRPRTGNVPWNTARLIAWVKCLMGRQEEYIAGQQPYSGPGKFENSCSLSRARFDYYQEIRAKEEHFQTSAASYGWLYGADILNRYLRETAWKKITVPVLLFQAEYETVVSKKEQAYFIKKLNSYGVTTGTFVKVANAKHEIFNASNEVQASYWEKVFRFIGQ